MHCSTMHQIPLRLRPEVEADLDTTVYDMSAAVEYAITEVEHLCTCES